MERLTVRVKEGNRKDECFIPGNKNAIEKVEYICEGERWESEEYKGKAVDKLAEYEDLEEQKRLLKLPCAVGDKVYHLCTLKSGETEMIEMKVGCVEPYGAIRNHKGVCEIWNVYAETDCTKAYFRFSDFNKTVFLTREEAEAALKEL